MKKIRINAVKLQLNKGKSSQLTNDEMAEVQDVFLRAFNSKTNDKKCGNMAQPT